MIILASGSPRRKDILKAHGIDPVVMPTDADETLPEYADSPGQAVSILAHRKARACRSMIGGKSGLIIAADTVVVVPDSGWNKFGILGKPRDKDEARQMISLIQGRSHHVMTGCCLMKTAGDNDSQGAINVRDDEEYVFHEDTVVHCLPMTDEQIEEYINTDEPYDKAGSYGIQGLFGKYIDHIDGDYENVVGLPYNRIKKEIDKINNETH